MGLLPLVVVAWADGTVDAKERKAVLEAAEGAGVAKGDAPHALLEAWLAVRPPENFMDAWEGYARELRDVLGASVEKRSSISTPSVGRLLYPGPKHPAPQDRWLEGDGSESRDVG